MNDLQQYFEDRKQFVELLEAVGISTLKEFSAIDPPFCLNHQAKRILKLETEIPAAPVFREWVAQALTAPRAASPDSITRAADFILPLATPVNTTEKTEETPKVLLPERNRTRRQACGLQITVPGRIQLPSRQTGFRAGTAQKPICGKKASST